MRGAAKLGSVAVGPRAQPGLRWAGRSVFRRVGWRIMAPYLLLTVLFAVVGTFLVTRLVTEPAEERFTNQLVESSRVLGDEVARQERAQLEVVRAIAFTDGIAEAAANGDAAEIARFVEPLAANSGTEMFELVGGDGYRVYGAQLTDRDSLAYSPMSGSTDRNAWPMVRAVLSGTRDERGDKFAGIVESLHGPALYTAAPLTVEGRVAGVVLVGTLLESFLPAAKGVTFSDLTLYDESGVVVATTFADRGRGDGDLRPDPRVLPGDRADGLTRERRTLFGREFDLVYGVWTVRGEPAGYFSVALPSSYITGASNAALWQMALLFGIVTIAVVVVGIILSRSLTEPLERVVQTARAVTTGDLTARTNVQSADEIGDLAKSFDVMTERLQRQHLATIGALATAIDARDPYTAGHSMRVGQLSAELGLRVGLPPIAIQHLEIGGYLHDIGKIGIRDSVLLKAGALGPRQRKLIQQHPRIGLEILAQVDLPEEVLAVVGGHHEKLDGSGYPLGLVGEDVTVFPRIAGIADMYDAMTTHRPYRSAMSVEEALAILEGDGAAGRLDHDIVRILRELAPEWERRRANDPLLRGYLVTERIFVRGAA